MDMMSSLHLYSLFLSLPGEVDRYYPSETSVKFTSGTLSRLHLSYMALPVVFMTKKLLMNLEIGSYEWEYPYEAPVKFIKIQHKEPCKESTFTPCLFKES